MNDNTAHRHDDGDHLVLTYLLHDRRVPALRPSLSRQTAPARTAAPPPPSIDADRYSLLGREVPAQVAPGRTRGAESRFPDPPAPRDCRRRRKSRPDTPPVTPAAAP